MYSIFSFNEIEEFRKAHKLQPFRIKQIYNNIYKNSIIDFADMTNLSKELREKLKEKFYVLSLTPIKIQESDSTTKITFKNSKGYLFETVLMYHYHTNNGLKKINRITICLSTQIGCAVGCKFCVTGKLGFVANLTSVEILEQIIWANNYLKNKFGKKDDKTFYKVRNVVFMGMGEPLLNYNNVKKSIEFMLDQTKLNLSKRHITISTCGILPGIQQMIEDNLNVMLAISLHSADPNLRKNLIPISSKYPLNELMKVLDDYVKKTNNRVFYEYIMINNITDTFLQAKSLVKLLKGRYAHVNLIPYNENPVVNFIASDLDTILKFKKYLENNGITVTIRNTMGDIIKGACGQLGYEILNSTK